MSAGAHSFETLFDQSPHTFGHAAGVMLLAGELETGGPALSIAAPLSCHALVARRRDPVVHAASANVEGPARLVYVLGEETAWNAWVDYVQGVTLALRESGHELPGFDVLVRSDLPLDAGLGSSTSLVVALLRALDAAYALELDEDALIEIAHRAKGAFGAAPSRATVEACVLGSERHVVYGRERIALPDAMEATLLLGRRRPAPPSVRPLLSPELAAARVEELASALRAGDAEEIGALLDTLPGPRCELLEATRRHPSVYGARCVKEGGAVVALVRRGEARALLAA